MKQTIVAVQTCVALSSVALSAQVQAEVRVVELSEFGFVQDNGDGDQRGNAFIEDDSAFLYVGELKQGNGLDRRMLMRFELPPDMDPEEVDSATLSVFLAKVVTDGELPALSLYHAAGGGVSLPKEASAYEDGGFTDTGRDFLSASSQPGVFHAVDVTGLVKKDLARGHGGGSLFRLQLDGADLETVDANHYALGGSSLAQYRPRLILAMVPDPAEAKAKRMPPAMAKAESFEIGGLRCGGYDQPLGIVEKDYLLGWRLEGSERGLAQRAYRVLAATSPDKLAEGKADLWDSGRVESDRSQWVAYAGKPLDSMQRVYWKVQVWDGGGRTSESGPSWFETGLLTPSDWQAKWIETDPALVNNELTEQWADLALTTRSSEKVEAHKRKVLHNVRANTILRTTFTLDEVPSAARLYASARGFYKVYVNGERVGEHNFDPVHGYHGSPDMVRAHDVTGLLHSGENEIRVALARGRLGYTHPNQWLDPEQGPPTELLLQLAAANQDGDVQVLAATDGTWRQAPGPLVKEYYFLGEVYDARLDRIRADLSDDDPLWRPVALSPRPIETVWNFLPPDRVAKRFPARRVYSPAEGVWVFDLGEPITGTVEFTEPEGMERGSPLILRYALKQRRDGAQQLSPSAMPYPEGTKVTNDPEMIARHTTMGPNYAIGYQAKIDPDFMSRLKTTADKLDARLSAIPTDLYLCSGKGGATWRSSARNHAFRYVEVIGLEEAPDPDMLADLFIHTDVEQIGGFACGNAHLNRFYDLSMRTQLGNTQGFLADCWDREKTSWNSDNIAQAAHMLYSYDITPVLRKITLDNAEIARDVNVPRPTSDEEHRPAKQYAPDDPEMPRSNAPLYQRSLAILPGLSWQFSGSRQSLGESSDAIMLLLRHYFSFTDEPRIDAIRWNSFYTDWLWAGHREGLPTMADGSEQRKKQVLKLAAFYHVAEYAQIALGPDGDPAELAWLAKLKEALRRDLEAYWSDEKQTYGDDPFNDGFGTDVEDATIAHSRILQDEARRQQLGRSIASQLAGRGYGPVNGTQSFWKMLDVLANTNEADAAYRTLNRTGYPGLRYMTDFISPDSMFEHIYARRPDESRSVFHATWSQISRWFFYGLGGLRPDADAPGFKHFVLAPQVPSDLDWAAIRHRSPYGEIVSDWKKENGRLVWTVVVPPNSTATAHLPAGSRADVTESGKPLAQSQGLAVKGTLGDRILCDLASGSYRFEIGGN